LLSKLYWLEGVDAAFPERNPGVTFAAENVVTELGVFVEEGSGRSVICTFRPYLDGDFMVFAAVHIPGDGFRLLRLPMQGAVPAVLFESRNGCSYGASKSEKGYKNITRS
jgi:hypothetical protein